MKKLLALLLALCAVSALAEEGGDEIPSLENTPSYEGTEIAVADTGVLFTIPSDWNAVDAPEGYLATYVSADNTLSLSLLLVNQGIEACYDEMLAMVEMERLFVDFRQQAALPIGQRRQGKGVMRSHHRSSSERLCS